MTACTACGTDVPAGAKFCPECGAAVAPRSCPSCGAPADRGRFCTECGAPLAVVPLSRTGEGARGPVTAERRVTSVLFADLVGFTPLSESKDAEEVRELLSVYFESCRTVIGRYGGVVEKFIGDAVMAVWGVPVAHEDDAERAVRAGLELVATVTAMGADVGAPGLAMRVGVVTGEVAVTLGATAEGMVAGDAVNTAARVQSVADPGQVWVDETTRALASAAIAFTDAGQHPLKGKADPAQLFTARAVVAELGGVQRVDGLEAPLTGRDRELRLVKELFHACEESRRPHLVVLDGTAGIGKSRLAWEFQKYIDGLSSTVRWHRGRCLSYGDGVAFWALAEAVRGRLGLTEGDSADQVGAQLAEGLGEFVTDPEEREWLRPRLASLIGASDDTFSREDLFAAWTTFLERVGGADPVVFVIDDAQYADDGLLDFLDHVLASARAGLFVLALARPELLERRRDLGGRRTTVVRLEPLDDTSMAALLDGLVVGLPAETRAALVARADGVPLFAVETVRALIDSDAVLPQGGQYVAAAGVEAALDAIGAPASLQALVAARLDALTPDERRVVADAAVLGMSFTRGGLVALGSDDDSLDAVVAALQRKEIVSVQTDRFSAERGQYRFVQSVVRQVAYATQSRRDRKARHLQAAAYLTSQADDAGDLALVIAQHLLDAVDAASEADPDVPQLTTQARDLLERAAGRARRLGSPAEAQRLLDAALGRADDLPDRARLLLAAAEAAMDAGTLTAAVEQARAATAAFDSLDRPVDAGVAAGVHALALTNTLDNSGAIDVAEGRLRTLAGRDDAERAQLRLARALAAAHTGRGELQEAAGYYDQCVLLAEALHDPEALAMGQLGLGLRYSLLGAPATARGLYELCAETARGHGLNSRLATALNNLASLALSRDLDEALEYGRQGVEVARRSGVRNQIDFTTGNYLNALWTAGRLAEQAAVLAEAQEEVSDPSIAIQMTTLACWLADATGTPFPPPPPALDVDSEITLAWLESARAQHAVAAGDAATTAQLTEAALSHHLAGSGIEDDFILIWPALVLAALAVNDTALATRLLEPVAATAPGLVPPAVQAQQHRLRGLVAAAVGEDLAEAERELRTGLADLEAFGAVGDVARTQEALGRLLLRLGRDEEADALLVAADTTYRSIGATGWSAQLDTWRETAGARTPH